MSTGEKTNKEEKKPKKPVVRMGWGNVKPATRVQPNKKKPVAKRKEKHKGKLDNANRDETSF